MAMPPDNLSDYLAVPGRIIPIPGTDYVVIAPDWEKYKARYGDMDAVFFTMHRQRIFIEVVCYMHLQIQRGRG